MIHRIFFFFFFLFWKWHNFIYSYVDVFNRKYWQTLIRLVIKSEIVERGWKDFFQHLQYKFWTVRTILILHLYFNWKLMFQLALPPPLHRSPLHYASGPPVSQLCSRDYVREQNFLVSFHVRGSHFFLDNFSSLCNSFMEQYVTHFQKRKKEKKRKHSCNEI